LGGENRKKSKNTEDAGVRSTKKKTRGVSNGDSTCPGRTLLGRDKTTDEGGQEAGGDGVGALLQTPIGKRGEQGFGATKWKNVPLGV